ncbi:hypothetical protein TNCT_625641 [Trichonephila clavata]|uniref:Endonuclease/exonuclease/phosphatase domain-containing protein n=1 Tax=Trichonephila clavata TaxID=2740835 RepID=A0A8X6H988_TRICU|nr:hypothetical protein TNCT_625641 [Trichonephila clavata]
MLTVDKSVTNGLAAHYQQILEAVEIDAWRGDLHYSVFFLYNPPNNRPNLDCLLDGWSRRSLLFGDFNAHSQKWGYSNTDAVGSIVENFIDSAPIEYIENKDSDPTFFSFGGATSHPDLVLAHPNLLNQITHMLLSAPGGAGHKLLVAELNSGFGRYREPRFPRWNLMKANWTRYQELMDYLVREVMTDETDNTDRAVDKFTEIILACAILCIPRGQRKKFSPFWNKELQTLKENRDKARNRAESTGMMSDCIELRKKQACLRRAIREAKRQTYRGFVENLDFRRDALRAHQFLSRLNNQKEKRNEPIRIADKLLTSEI